MLTAAAGILTSCICRGLPCHCIKAVGRAVRRCAIPFVESATALHDDTKQLSWGYCPTGSGCCFAPLQARQRSSWQAAGAWWRLPPRACRTATAMTTSRVCAWAGHACGAERAGREQRGDIAPGRQLAVPMAGFADPACPCRCAPLSLP